MAVNGTPNVTRLAMLALACFTAAHIAVAETIFVEAESFTPSSPGWRAVTTPEIARASRVKTMWGADGPGDAAATKTLTLREAGRYRVWVRWLQVSAWRGPFRVAVSAGGREIAAYVFDQQTLAGVEDWDFAWQFFPAELPAGEVTLTLSKHERKNCVGYVRHVDCLLLTTDEKLKPSHVPYGPQTLLRVTLVRRPSAERLSGSGDPQRPVYLHIFADHYRHPWYSHHAIGKAGLRDVLSLPAGEMLRAGDRTPWSNLSAIVYQDSGVALNMSLRYSYWEKAERLLAKLEFGRLRAGRSADRPVGDDDVEAVKTFDVDCQPNGLVVNVPPHLDSPENVARLRRDLDFAEETGRQADTFVWPAFGRPPQRLPFLVSANIGGYDLPVDASVTARERKTLAYFGFNGGHERVLGGLWFMKGDSYCRPDLERMREHARRDAERFRQTGRKLDELAACMLMDEPGGQPASFLARDDAYCDAFRDWLRKQGLTPQELLESDWDAVRPVAESARDQHPALHYFTQRFRTVALGDFMAAQQRIIEANYGRKLPTCVNFSDGAVYHANFYSQGVDYFELLDRDDQNAIWGEDWSNLASSYQCAAFNVDLMRAAARQRGQTVGHYLIAHAGRTPWDIELKAASETARGVRMWMNFCYGPSWGSHEGGPPWRTHLWYAKPETWLANAEILREIGGVEDWLLTARPAPAEVALLYNSSSDIWTMASNFAFGFDRMHTWLALSHGQMPVDIVSERDVASGRLSSYRVCYLSGPNLTRAAGAKLKAWVEAGGTLWLTAGAASRDEFNRPLDTLTALLPADRGELATLEPHRSAGRFLSHLATKDKVRWQGTELAVLSVKQSQKPRAAAAILANFADGTPAVVASAAGRGRIISLGFLPALSYVKPALTARQQLEKAVAADSSARAVTSAPPIEVSDRERLARSHNPWAFPAAVRELLLTPVKECALQPPISCDLPLVDLVYLPCEQGALIALANYSLQPCSRMQLRLNSAKRVTQVESVRRGRLPVQRSAAGAATVALPLAASDWLKVTFERRR